MIVFNCRLTRTPINVTGSVQYVTSIYAVPHQYVSKAVLLSRASMTTSISLERKQKSKILVLSGFQVALKFLKILILLSLPKILKKSLKKNQIPKKALIFHKHPKFFSVSSLRMVKIEEILWLLGAKKPHHYPLPFIISLPRFNYVSAKSFHLH